jgi:NitT/TauT family transport system permease protein
VSPSDPRHPRTSYVPSNRCHVADPVAPTPVRRRRPPRAERTPARLRALVLGVAGLLAVALVWEGYKALGPDGGLVLAGTRVLPRTSDLAMPHTWEVLVRLVQPETSRPDAIPLWRAVVDAGSVTLAMAAAGLVVGAVVGLALGVAMHALKVVELGLLPWVIVSQTVPLIAFAPVVNSVGSRLQIGTVPWPDWLSIAVIASYLAFFPVAIGTLRGLQATPRTHVELLRTYAARPRQELLTVRLPGAVPYLLPALRLGAANAVIGTVVAEVSIGLRGGIGRMIIEFAATGSADPAKQWSPIVGAVIMGLVAAGAVALLGLALRRYRRAEVDA